MAAQIPAKWSWHYRTLCQLRERLLQDRKERLSEAAEPLERHSMHLADSATDAFDHDLALSRLSAAQDALYEVEAAMMRITDGGYGVCEQTGKRIPAIRLKMVPWTRFREDVEARLESTGIVPQPSLGTLRSVRSDPAAALTESEPTVEEPEATDPLAEAAVEPTEA